MKLFLFLFCLLTANATFAQQQYDGKAVILFGDTVQGKITVRLDAPNDEMINIVTKEASKKKGKGKKQTESQSMKLDAGMISQLLVNGNSYKFKDLRNGYGDSTIARNCAVKRIAGTDTVGLFEFRNAAGAPSYYLQGPKDGFSIYNIENPYVAGAFSSFSLLRFYKCKFVREKIKAEEPGYFYNDKSTLDAKLQTWKNIIAAYYENCVNE